MHSDREPLQASTLFQRVLLATVLLAACGGPAPVDAQQTHTSVSLFESSPATQQSLPNELGEISGLAVSPDGRLFAHDDERAVIYQIDPARGAIVKSFALGDPVETGDFEGLAITPDGTFWMTTSKGRLYRFSEGADQTHVTFERLDSGLSDVCEIEGLAFAPSEQSLILACKRNKARRMRDTVSLYRWAFSGAAEPWRALREADIAAAAGVEHFRPSSIDFDAASGRILLLSASDGALAELAADGALAAARRLGPTHVQAEGVVVLPDGALVIADEAAGGRPLLSRYGRVS